MHGYIFKKINMHAYLIKYTCLYNKHAQNYTKYVQNNDNNDFTMVPHSCFSFSE